MAAITQPYLNVHIGQLEFTPVETVVLAFSLAAALLCLYQLWRIAGREYRLIRLEALRERAAGGGPARPPRGAWYGWLGTMVAASPIIGRTEQQRLLGVLSRAGFRGQGALPMLTATKVVTGVGLAVATWAFLELRQVFPGLLILRVVIVVIALMVGFRFPDFVLGRLAARRQLKIEQGMPDALDLLVVCAEAGLSLDQAIDQVSRDLRPSHPEIAAEFATTAAEMRVLSDRAEALDNLVERTRVEGLRSVTATLVQAIRFGTPLAESLRTVAAEMRNLRLLRIEERAARLPVLLTLPLMGFMMPALFMIIGTPIVLRLYDFFKHLSFNGLPL